MADAGLKCYRLQQAADQLLRWSHRDLCFEPVYNRLASGRQVAAWERVVLCLAAAEYGWIPVKHLRVALDTLQSHPQSLPPYLNIVDPSPDCL